MPAKRSLTDDDVRALADALHEPSTSQKMNSILRGAAGKSRAEREGPIRARLFDRGKGAEVSTDDPAKALTEANAERDAANAEREKHEADRDLARAQREEASA